MRGKALTESDNIFHSATAIQWCFDERVVDKIDHCIFLGQLVDAVDMKHESVFAVKSFLPQIYSLMAGTTALNTGKLLESILSRPIFSMTR